MASIKAIKGTQDVLPSESHKIQYIEKTALEVAALYGYREERTPVFEYTELFQRSVGDTTDIVQKEMYTFEDKGGRSITLRPEGTAGAVRLLLEHALYNEGLPQKVAYLTSCYRYEKPQAGRLREFHQFGIECFGAQDALADAEIISLADRFFKKLGVKDLALQINSIGCPECRKAYHSALKQHFESNKEQLCGTCHGRLETNPMRILDCKSPVCGEIAKDAPRTIDYLCDECKEHFENLQKHLTAMGIDFTVNTSIVRGLDYYTKTVFEFVSNSIGAQGTVCGGGRYDGLVEQMGGTHIPSLGFGLGIERLILLMEAQNCYFPEPPKCDVYIACIGENSFNESVKYVNNLRENGIAAQFDLTKRSLKAQMKYADKIGAKYVVVIGDDEIATDSGKLKNMETGEQTPIKLSALADEYVKIAK
ncbi:MAG: histidine--tRNA ligase [Clostridia bacterium]|nr:histidine--tRNA ligase [Clostridia bacterium]